ncbi:hypothetical protein V5O48_010550 [Marasmius crinis-equi]|uniref:Uncharacterized protein n=1 Tax=Marasmius crinis-equi TaxID=585013 RepID=A0ABR3F816_9AGAR
MAKLNLFLEGREERLAKVRSKEAFREVLAPVFLAAWTQGAEEASKSFIDRAWSAWVDKWPEEEETDKKKLNRAKQSLAWGINMKGYKSACTNLYLARKNGEPVPSDNKPEESVAWEIQFESAIEGWKEGLL